MPVATELTASLCAADDSEEDAASAACRMTNGLAFAWLRSARIVKGSMVRDGRDKDACEVVLIVLIVSEHD
jgi:hypothetical protein